METKREKFIRLAEARTNKAIGIIRLIGNCSNKNLYDYTDDDVNQIFNTLQTELNAAKRRFAEYSHQNDTTFKLK